MTVQELCIVLLDKYSLSDLEFALGADIRDLENGLEEFVIQYKGEIEEMIEEDASGTLWDN